MSGILSDAWQRLLADRNAGDHEIDIVGFSRGGVEAIEFANRIAAQLHDETIRFVGLFDPVGSVGFPGEFGTYHSTLPSAVQRSVQAVARDENRSWFLATDAHAQIRQSFRGRHSDIGGGFADHQLSDWVLKWMVEQAQSAGVQMDLQIVKEMYGWDPQENGRINNNPHNSPTYRGPRRFAVQDGGTEAYSPY